MSDMGQGLFNLPEVLIGCEESCFTIWLTFQLSCFICVHIKSGER